MSDTGDSFASAAGGRPDDVQEEETCLFDLFEDFKNHFLLSPEDNEEILQRIQNKLRQKR